MTLLRISKFTPPADGEQPPLGEVCYENIGPRERQVRRRFAMQALAFGLVLVAVLLFTGASPWWRLLVFFPFAVAITNWLQARERTWLSLAALGQRNLDTGLEKVEDPWLRNRLRLQGLWIAVRASMVAAAVTAVLLLVP